MKKKVLKIAKLLLVVLFVSYYCESSLFYHTHYFSWGVVTHSHPYLPAGSGTPGHNHTPVQCDTIAQLSMLLFVAGISLVSFFVPGVEVRFRPPVRHGRESSSAVEGASRVGLISGRSVPVPPVPVQRGLSYLSSLTAVLCD